jgi:hypothetical protein
MRWEGRVGKDRDSRKKDERGTVDIYFGISPYY